MLCRGLFLTARTWDQLLQFVTARKENVPEALANLEALTDPLGASTTGADSTRLHAFGVGE